VTVPHVFVDADACPVKPEVYRVAERYDLEVTLVAASWMRLPANGRVALQVVEHGFDAADDWIAERAGPASIVITADIPLAARCVAAGAFVLGTTGVPFTEANIGDTLATRDLMATLRGAGEITGGPAPFDARDRSRFLQALDNAVHAVRRRSGA
jgi:uncharacterized protein YaiI (UPF0178 family)